MLLGYREIDGCFKIETPKIAQQLGIYFCVLPRDGVESCLIYEMSKCRG